jgi:hypothetical protein
MRNHGVEGTRRSLALFRTFRGFSELPEEKTWRQNDKSLLRR